MGLAFSGLISLAVVALVMYVFFLRDLVLARRERRYLEDRRQEMTDARGDSAINAREPGYWGDIDTAEKMTAFENVVAARVEMKLRAERRRAQKSDGKKRLAYLAVGLALAGGVAGAAAAFRSAIPFGTASSWSSAVNSDPNAVQGIWSSSVNGHSFYHHSNGYDYETDLAPFSAFSYGCYGDDSHDDTTCLNNAAAAIVASGKRGALVIPFTTAAYKITSAININLSYVSIIGTGAKIDATTLAAGSAFVFTGTVSPPYTQSTNIVQGIEVAGPGIGTSVKGFDIENTGGSAGVSHITFASLNIHDFGTGIYFGSNAYVDNFNGIDVYNCAVGIDVPNGTTNAGERLSFDGSTIFNNTIGVRNSNANGDLDFEQCSFDFNTQQFLVQNTAKTSLTNCHIEGNNSSATTPITISSAGGAFSMVGGMALFDGTPPGAFAQYVDASGGGSANFKNVFMTNLLGTTDFFGLGDVTVSDYLSYSTTQMPILLSSSKDKTIDGGFEASALNQSELMEITADTATITDPFTGTNIILALDATQSHGGTQSLKLTKAFGAGSASEMVIMVPVTANKRANFRFWYEKTGAQTGSFAIAAKYVAVRNTGAALPNVLKSSTRGSVTVTLTSSALPWTKFATADPMLLTPSWATHILLDINLNLFVGAGSINIDDLLVTEM